MARDLAIMFFLIAASFWKLTFSRGYTFLESPDIANQVLPWLQIQARAFQEGTIALWDPYTLGGQPLVGQLQPAVTSPFTYLLLALPLKDGRLDPVMVHYWFVLLHMIAGMFAYLLFRDLRLHRAASVLGAYFFAIGGYNGNTNWPQYLAGAIWLPLIALFLTRCLTGRRPVANAAISGAVLGLSWLSGHHQVPFFTSMAIAAAFLIAAVMRRGLSVVASAVVLFAMAALVSAVQVLPALEFGKLSVRWVAGPEPIGWDDKVPYEVHRTHALGLRDLIFTIFPGGEETISNPVMGIAALTFALLGVLLCWQRLIAARAFFLLAAGSMAFVLARALPLHRILYELVPGLDKARSPATALSLTHFAVAGLMAVGLDEVLQRGAGGLRPWRWLAAFGALACLGPLLFQPAFVRGVEQGVDRFAAVGFVGLGLALVLRAHDARWVGRATAPALVAGLLLAEHAGSTGYGYRRLNDRTRIAVLAALTGGTDDVAAFLRRHGGRSSIHFDDVLFNFGPWHGLETLSGYLPGVLAVNYRLGWWDPRVLAMYGVRHTVAKHAVREGQREVFAAAGGGLKVFEDPAAVLPRAWIVHRVRVAADAAREVRSGSFPLDAEAVVEAPDSPLEVRCDAPSTASVVSRRLHSVAMEADAACRGLLILSETFYPGWEATVDGKPAPIIRANVALRGVALEKGRHRVEMRYRPRSVYTGLALTLVGLALAAAAVVTSWR